MNITGLSRLTCARVIATGILAVAGGILIPSPAFAIDGRNAVGLCIDSTASGARCAWSVSPDGSIDICNKNGCVTCPSATEECTMAKRKDPKTTMPVGSRVTTVLGAHTVRPVDRTSNIANVIKAAKKAGVSAR